MTQTRRSFVTGLAGGFVMSALPLHAKSAPLPLTLALQDGGTASWELAAMQALGLDQAAGLDISVRPVADSRAGQVALQTGAADVILSDFLWTSIQRHQGAGFTIVPHSLAVGGLLVHPDSGITALPDLVGQTIAVAGGPVDKSYVILQALFRQETGLSLPDVATLRFGAPPLVRELLVGRQVPAALNFWHFNARAAAQGMVELLSVKDMLAALGVSRTPPLLGWVFSDTFAAAHPETIRRYLDASFATKVQLMVNDPLWEDLRPLMNVGADNAMFFALRDAYRAGIVQSYGAEDIAAATQTFAIMAAVGGAELVGDHATLADGTFWSGYQVAG